MAVVDTNVILHGRGEISYDKLLLTSGILEEVESQRGNNILMNLDYEVTSPGAQELEQVKKKSEDINSPTSRNDEELLALAMTQDDFLVTDDKALQNLALRLNVEVKGFNDEVLENVFRYELRCENCGKKLASQGCPRCGSQDLRRKQVRCS